MSALFTLYMATLTRLCSAQDSVNYSLFANI